MNHSEKANTINRGICLSVIISMLALLAGLLAVTQPARAIPPTPIVVKNSNDTGKDSLRWAIDEANKNSDADLITFHKDTDGKPIILVWKVDEDANDNGDLDILDGGGDLTIQGNGATKTIINGGGKDRVFHVCPVVPIGGCANTVTFTGMTIRNGKANYGGGINNASGAAIVDSSTIISNTATINGGGIFTEDNLTVRNGSTIGGAGAANMATSNGGGIFSRAGTITVDASTVSANTATNGGGIYSNATLYVQNGSTIGAANSAISNGGGIYNRTGTTTVEASTVSANTAGIGGGIYNKATLVVGKGSTIGAANDAVNGGGIYNAGTTTVDASTVTANTSVTGGGGIYNADTTTLIGSTVTANQASYGGGIYSEGTLNIEKGSTIGGANIADNNGGGIFIETGTTIVDASTVSTNTASRGGGIYNEATLYVQNGSTIGGPGTGNIAEEGGGIYNWDDSTTTVDASTISDNEADSDGGGIFSSAATVLVQNGSTIGGPGTGNIAEEGGGIYLSYGTTTVDSSTVSDNMAFDNGGGIWSEGLLIVKNGSTIGGAGAGNWAEDAGGGIFNYDGTAAVNDSTISDNEADYYGGGIRNSGYMTVTNSIILTNTAVLLGGGIHNHGDMTLNGSTVSANEADKGGGIYNASTMTVNASTVSANTAVSIGGGVYSNFGTTTVNASTVSANEADKGGGIYNWHGTATVNGSTVSANTAKNGGGIYNFIVTMTVTDTHILNNIAANDGGGIYNDDGTMTVTTSRILNNTAANQGGGVFSNTTGVNETKVMDGCIVGNSEVSYYNNQPAQQIATGNWWGAVAGPNTPGADTTGGLGSVLVLPWSKVPILGCTPDLHVNKANDTNGKGYVGVTFHWTLTISNTGPASATFAAGDIILKDDLPTGPTYGDPVIGPVVNVTNGDKIQCDLAADTLTCTADGADVTFGGVDSFFDVTFSIKPDAEATLANPGADGICKVDPGGKVTEDDEGNNDCPENVVTISAPDLQVGKVNDTSGKGEVGTPFHWTLTISNTGPASATFASGDTILIDDLPTGPAYDDPVIGTVLNVTNGDKIQCGLAADTLTCTATGADVTFGGVDSYFDITFSITPDAAATLVNPDADGICQVDPNGKVTEGDENNNDCPENTVDVSVSANFLYLPAVMK